MARRSIRYKSNRTPGGKDVRDGARVTDDVTGAWTRERRLVTDLFGNRVDPRIPGAWDSADHRGGKQGT